MASLLVPPLHGVRVTLRDFRMNDLPAYRAWLAPGHAWQRFDGPYFDPDTEAEVDARVERLRRRIAARDWRTPRPRLVIADRAGDRLIGTVAWYWQMRETAWPAAGIGIFEVERWGHGLGFEALGLWVDYLFAVEPRFMRMDLRTWSGNHGMVRLAEKLGFAREACFRRAVVVEGRRYDSLGYGILREEWEARYADGFGTELTRDATGRGPPESGQARPT